MGGVHPHECEQADPGSLCDCDCAGARHAVARSAGGMPAAGAVSRRAQRVAARDGRAPVVSRAGLAGTAKKVSARLRPAGSIAGRRPPRIADVSARAAVRSSTRGTPKAGPTHERVKPLPGRDLADETLALRTRAETAELRAAEDAALARPGDPLLGHLLAKQGWTAPSIVGSRAEVDAAVAAGWTEIHRGVGDFTGWPAGERRTAAPGRSAAEIADDTATGEHTPGTGIYGNGDYYSVNRDVAQIYADGSDTYGGTPRAREKGQGVVIRAALHPNARVADYTELITEHKAWMDEVRANADSVWNSTLPLDELEEKWEPAPGKYHPSMEGYFSDVGRYAALRGYDAIRVQGLQDGSGRSTKPRGGKRGPGADQYVILNRTAVLSEARA